MHQNWHGICEPEITTYFDLILYPGYRCRGDEVYGIWRFGTKICNKEDRCEGYQAYSRCKRTSDWNFGHYCNENGICLELNLEGELCATNDSCEKNYMCYYLNPTHDFGTWVKVASKDDREQVLPMYNGLPVKQEDMEKLWRSGVVNRTTGNWATKLKSKNKGKICSTETDCPTSDENVNSAWKWGYNENGNSYCDIEAGDKEWVDATSKFQEFFLLNLDCHTGEGFGECGNKDSTYKSYKWAEFKAKYYVELLNNPDCLKANYKNSPIFWEYSFYCFAWNFNIASSLLIFTFILLIL